MYFERRRLQEIYDLREPATCVTNLSHGLLESISGSRIAGREPSLSRRNHVITTKAPSPNIDMELETQSLAIIAIFASTPASIPAS